MSVGAYSIQLSLPITLIPTNRTFNQQHSTIQVGHHRSNLIGSVVWRGVSVHPSNLIQTYRAIAKSFSRDHSLHLFFIRNNATS